MDWLAGVVEAADGPWGLAVVFLCGLYVLLWKYGGELLKLSRESNHVAKLAHSEARATAEKADELAEAIVTNHGSRNIGDAIDRLTEWMHRHMAESRRDAERINEIALSQQQLAGSQEQLALYVNEKLDQNQEIVDFSRAVMRRELIAHLRDEEK